MLLPDIPWAGRVWGLPFLTALAPSERYAKQHQRRHKKLTDWARQTLLQVAQWLPGRQIIAVADSSYAVIDLLNAVRRRICMITRMRLDAWLFAPTSTTSPRRRRPTPRHRIPPTNVGRAAGRSQDLLAESLFLNGSGTAADLADQRGE